ncbi:MAG TPA: preprotein translocase subunit YajC [Clostridiaceae bacterium]|nr:preprotein translocase subunit YajC [Clostridiaceae bacterium]
MTFSLPYSVLQSQGDTGSILGMLAPFVLLFAVMYFLMIRPQKKKEKALKEQLASMRVGDKIVTIGGIVGRIASMSDDEVTIYTSVANTMMTFKKNAVSAVNQPAVVTESNPELPEDNEEADEETDDK